MEQGQGGDRELIARTAQGEVEAFHRLVSRHEARVWRLVRYRSASEAVAEEALQETFLAVWGSAGSYRGESTVRSWILGLARRQVARTWRRRAGEPQELTPLHELGALAGWGSHNPEAAAEAAEDSERLHRALPTLSASDQEVITLRDLEQLTGPETAALLEVSLGAVKTRLHRARLRLVAALREEVSHG